MGSVCAFGEVTLGYGPFKSLVPSMEANGLLTVGRLGNMRHRVHSNDVHKRCNGKRVRYAPSLDQYEIIDYTNMRCHEVTFFAIIVDGHDKHEFSKIV
jgi:hypothetical protein